MGTNGDKISLKKVSFRIASTLAEECEREARQLKLPLSHILRDRFLQKGSSDFSNREAYSQIFSQLEFISKNLEQAQSSSTNQNFSSLNHSLLIEILFLLREFLFERNAQVLKKVDEKLDHLLGKERKKIR